MLSRRFIAATPSFSTDFPLTENPIVQDGGWTRGFSEGANWTDPQTTGGSPGEAWPTMISAVPGDIDSIAHRSGFANDHYTKAIIKGTGISGIEVELLLRFQITSGNARGYEIDIVPKFTTVAIARWNGALNSFNIIANSGTNATFNDGDVYEAWIQGSLIYVKCNGVFVHNGVDAQAWAVANGGSYWSTGQPGMGFWNETGSSNSGFGFKHFECRNYP